VFWSTVVLGGGALWRRGVTFHSYCCVTTEINYETMIAIRLAIAEQPAPRLTFVKT
jgi:hypothetical protein